MDWTNGHTSAGTSEDVGGISEWEWEVLRSSLRYVARTPWGD